MITRDTPPRARLRFGSDRGSLPMAMLIILVGMALAAMALPVVVGQTSITTNTREQAQATQAAKSAVTVTVNRIRAALDSNPTPAALPCGTITGSIGDAGISYRATIRYYQTRPTGQSEAWLTTNQLPCPVGGTVRYVLIDAYGINPQGETISNATEQQVRRLIDLGMQL